MFLSKRQIQRVGYSISFNSVGSHDFLRVSRCLKEESVAGSQRQPGIVVTSVSTLRTRVPCVLSKLYK